ELVDGYARLSDGRSVSFAELATDGLRVDAAFANNNKLTYTYGSAAAHVAVDPGTGRVELLDCLVVEDVGRIVNPLTLPGQASGGMVQGLGGAFLEHLVYDANGQLLARQPRGLPDPDGDRFSEDPGDCTRKPPVT